MGTPALPPRPLPVMDDPDTGGFWEAATRGELAVRTCLPCGQVLHAPTSFCPACRSFDTGWTPVSGRGHLYSWAVVEHQTHPAFPVPYTIVLVQLDDAPVRLLGHLPGRADLEAGQPMAVRFEAQEDGTVLPQWEPVHAN